MTSAAPDPFKKKKPRKTHKLVLAFADVQNGKSRVISGCVSSIENAKTKQKISAEKMLKHDPAAHAPKTNIYKFCQAVDVELPSRHRIAPMMARIEAVAQFLKKAKKKHAIVIYTNDTEFLRTNHSLKVQEKLNDLKSKFAEFSIQPTTEEEKTGIDLAEKSITYRLHELSKNNKESKDYINRKLIPANNH